MLRNEADTRAQLIDPQLKAAGWTDSQVTREHTYHRDRAYTDGRIYLRGDQARRGARSSQTMPRPTHRKRKPGRWVSTYSQETIVASGVWPWVSSSPAARARLAISV